MVRRPSYLCPTSGERSPAVLRLSRSTADQIHHSFMQLHSQLSQWIVDTIEAQHMTILGSKLCFYFIFMTTPPKPPRNTVPYHALLSSPLLMNELMALYEDNQRNQPKMFGKFFQYCCTKHIRHLPNQQQHIFLMTCLNAIARVCVYAAYRNSMEQMLACERGTLLRFLAIPSLCGLALLASLFTHNTPVLLQLGLLYGLIRYVRFFVRSHAFDHYYNGGRTCPLFTKLDAQTQHRRLSLWHQALHFTAAFSIPEPEKNNISTSQQHP